ncbi:MAG: RsmE family RNA methyltransferase [bacterium]
MRCYVPPSDWSNELITLSRDEAHHAAHVLRAKVGQPVKVFDGCGREGVTEIKELKRNRVTLKMVQQSAKPKPRVSLTLVQALTREQRLDFILQKATELGATTIIPVVTEHAITRIRPGEEEARQQRWQKIVLNAAKQCGAVWMPDVQPPVKMQTFLETSPRYDLFLVGSLAIDAKPLREVIHASRDRERSNIAFLIGPEGDLTVREDSSARNAGAIPVSLGDLTLRAETAAIYALSVLKYEFAM